MKNKKWYEWLLPVVFAAMVVLCVVLNLTAGQKESLENIIVNGAMFVIVAVIFISCDLHCFCPMSDIAADLDRAADKIRKDAMNSHQYLWEPYSSSHTELFSTEKLQEAFQDYRFELNRNAESENACYKCSIEDYINEDLVDTVMRRNQLNQVAGALTGLGILGTFIGLSLGLQQFNTGSTAEITGSIEPLMEGIKVAFHTSIYGMIFSLVFNYVYKRKLYESEESVRDFVSAWKKFVMPDTTNDGMNRMLQIQAETLASVQAMSGRLTEELAAILNPGFDRLERLITEFTAAATRDQQEAMRQVVEKFLTEMNLALQGSFTKLGTMVEEEAVLQKQNLQLVQEFQRRVLAVQEEMKKNLLGLSMQSENNAMMFTEAKKEFKEVVDACDDATDAADELRLSIEKMQKGRR